MLSPSPLNPPLLTLLLKLLTLLSILPVQTLSSSSDRKQLFCLHATLTQLSLAADSRLLSLSQLSIRQIYPTSTAASTLLLRCLPNRIIQSIILAQCSQIDGDLRSLYVFLDQSPHTTTSIDIYWIYRIGTLLPLVRVHVNQISSTPSIQGRMVTIISAAAATLNLSPVAAAPVCKVSLTHSKRSYSTITETPDGLYTVLTGPYSRHAKTYDLPVLMAEIKDMLGPHTDISELVIARYNPITPLEGQQPYPLVFRKVRNTTPAPKIIAHDMDSRLCEIHIQNLHRLPAQVVLTLVWYMPDGQVYARSLSVGYRPSPATQRPSKCAPVNVYYTEVKDGVRRTVPLFGVNPDGTPMSPMVGVALLLLDNSQLLTAGISALLMVVLVLVVASLMTVIERKVLGAGQRRAGPSQSGYHGLLQVVADGGKLVVKEQSAYAATTWSSPLIAAMAGFVSVGLVLSETIGIAIQGEAQYVAIALLLTVSHVGIILAGWSTWSVYARLASRRAVLQAMISEAILLLLWAAVVSKTGTLSRSQQVQSYCPNGVALPLLALALLIAALLEQGRIPMDIQEAESELVGGFNTEFYGLQYALQASGEYSAMLASTVVAVLFLTAQSTITNLTIAALTAFCLLVVIRLTMPRIAMHNLSTVYLTAVLPASAAVLLS